MSAAPSLMTLQNLVRRDPDGYTEEVSLRLRHFQSLLAILEQQSGSSPPDFLALLGFISHTAACFPAMMADVPEGLGKLLDERHDVLEPAVRRAILQALVLLRNRGLVPSLNLLQRCFRLFRCRDKVLRTRLYTYVVADIKAANQKHRDQPLNRALQNHVIAILQDASSSVGAKYALRAMIELYRRHVWRDEKTVNVIASALFCPHPKLRLAALHFLLGEHDTPKPGEDSDEEEAGMTQAQIERLRESLGKEGAQPVRCSNKKKRKLQRAMRSHKTRTKEQTAASFAAIHLLHDPHTVAEKLFGEVRPRPCPVSPCGRLHLSIAIRTQWPRSCLGRSGPVSVPSPPSPAPSRSLASSPMPALLPRLPSPSSPPAAPAPMCSPAPPSQDEHSVTPPS
jgi:protein SDA1